MLSADTYSHIINLLLSDLSVHKIAEQVGVAISTVMKIRKKHIPNATIAIGGQPEVLLDCNKIG